MPLAREAGNPARPSHDRRVFPTTEEPIRRALGPRRSALHGPDRVPPGLDLARPDATRLAVRRNRDIGGFADGRGFVATRAEGPMRFAGADEPPARPAGESERRSAVRPRGGQRRRTVVRQQAARRAGHQGEPDWGDPDWGEPDWGEPDWGEPDWGEPDWGEPDWGDPDWGDPDWGEPRKITRPTPPAWSATLRSAKPLR